MVHSWIRIRPKRSTVTTAGQAPLDQLFMTLPDEKRFASICFALCVVLNLWFSATGWNHTLLESHEFRQTQTAISARAIQQDGWQLAYPLPLFGPPWSAPFEFPFYQILVAQLGSLGGLPLEQSGRAVALLFLYLALPALYLLQEFLPIPRSRWFLLPSLVLVSPVYLYYSRSFMIESVALCAAAWFLFAYARALTRPTWAGGLVTALLGVLAGLAKSTTFAVFLLAAGLLTFAGLRRSINAGPKHLLRVIGRSLALAAPGVIAVMGWTRYTDQIKAMNPLSRSLEAGQLSEFIFGSLRLRFEPAFWVEIAGRTAVTVLDSANAMLLVVFGGILARQRHWALAGLLLCFASGPLIFPRLYAVHDYYFYASGVFILTALTLAWSNLLDMAHFPRAAGYVVIILSFALQVSSYTGSYYQSQRRPTPPPPELAKVLRELTQPGEIVLIIGQDWNPVLPYFAERRAIMVRDEAMSDPERLAAVLRSLGPGDEVAALVVTGEYRKYPKIIRALTQPLGLQSDPLLMNTDTHLHLATRLVGAAMVRVGQMHLTAFTLIDNTIENLNMPRHRYPAKDLTDPRILQFLDTALEEIVHPFNLAVHEVDGRPVLDAHAPTDLVFGLTPGHSNLLMEFGVLPGAWQAERPTDGIEIRVEFVPAEGPMQVLFSQQVQPVEQPSDRNSKRISIPLPFHAPGKLRLRTLPGPADSIACDWAYWSKVVIQ